MAKKIIIIDNEDRHFCVFCGKQLEEQIGKSDEGYPSYYECKCADVKKLEKINSQIRDLKLSRPQPKFVLVKEKRYVLQKIEE